MLCTTWQFEDNCASVLLSFWWVLLSSLLRWSSAVSHPRMVVPYPPPFLAFSPLFLSFVERALIIYIFIYTCVWEETTTTQTTQKEEEWQAPPFWRRKCKQDHPGRLPPPPPTPNSSLDGNPTHPETTNFSLRKLCGFKNASRSPKNT